MPDETRHVDNVCLHRGHHETLSAETLYSSAGGETVQLLEDEALRCLGKGPVQAITFPQVFQCSGVQILTQMSFPDGIYQSNEATFFDSPKGLWEDHRKSFRYSSFLSL